MTTWFVDAARTRIDWTAAVSGTTVQVDIFQLDRDGTAESLTVFRRSGSRITAEALAATKALASAAAVPAPIASPVYVVVPPGSGGGGASNVDLTPYAKVADLQALTSTVAGKADQSALSSLTTTVSGKASTSSVTSLTTTVNGKAAQSDLTALQSLVNGKTDTLVLAPGATVPANTKAGTVIIWAAS